MRLQLFIRALAPLLGALLASCAGGSAVVPASNSGPIASAPSSTGGSSVALFVPNDLGVTGNVVAFDADASGNVAPIATIAGSNTSLGPAEGVAFDASGDMYVSNKGVGCVTSCVAVFAAGASGNVAPIRKICGNNTQLSGLIAGIAVDSAGFTYVAQGPENILVFAPGANGNVAPVRVITGQGTGLASPVGIGVDAKGDVYVANETGGSSGSGTVTEYAPGASGAAAPIATIAGSSTLIASPRGLTLANGKIYVVNGMPGAFSVAVFPQGANGNVAPSNFIMGPSTMLAGPNGVAADSSGNIYVTNDASPAYVTVYGPLIGGDVPPIQTIEGGNTGLVLPNLPALH
jgi:surface antigen